LRDDPSLEDGLACTIHVDDDASTYTFDRVFDTHSSQATVFEFAAKPVVEEVFNGKDGNGMDAWEPIRNGTLCGPKLKVQGKLCLMTALVVWYIDICVSPADDSGGVCFNNPTHFRRGPAL